MWLTILIVYAEKPSVGTNLAAVIGGCIMDGKQLVPQMIEDRKYEQLINKYRKKGYLECNSGGKKYIVTWGYGHMAELKRPSEYDEKYKHWSEDIYPFIPDKFEIVLKQKVQSQFKVIRNLFNNPETEYIICATDYDREGNLIFEYVYTLCRCRKPWKRLIIHSNEEKELKKAFNNLKERNEVLNVTAAGRSRAIADYLCGINFSVLATIKYKNRYDKAVFSIGRVQTATLALIVNREKNIKNFKKENYYEIEGTFSLKDGSVYKGKWLNPEKNPLKEKEKAELIFNRLNQCTNSEIIKYERKTEEEKPPLLYDLTTLQMAANDKYGLSAAQTLSVTQTLYEKKFVTYPRTDSRYLRTSIYSGISDIINALPAAYDQFKAETTIDIKNKRVFDDNKVESHYALIPSTRTPSQTELNQNEIKIYGLIVRSFIKVFMKNALWNKLRIETKIGEDLFVTTGITLISEGWRKAEKKTTTQEDDENNDESNDISDNFPVLDEHTKVTPEHFHLLTKETKPPQRFNEKTLLAAMETSGKFVEDEELRDAMKAKGMGTPATRAAIIERLITVGYVERKGKKLIPTDKGTQIIDILPIEELKSPGLTGMWEYRLKQIERGEESEEKFKKDIIDFTIKMSNILKVQKYEKSDIPRSYLGKCPKCGGYILKFMTKSKKVFYGCSNYKEKNCRFMIYSQICKKKITSTMVKDLLSKGITRKQKGFISKAGKEFEASLKLIQDQEGNYKLAFNFSDDKKK